MNLEEKTLSSESKFEGRIFRVRVDDIELPNGAKSKREVVDHNGGVCVLVLDNDDNALFVKQFRYPYKEVLLEIPAGKLEKGEDPFEAMKREQREETGTKGENYVYLGDFYPTAGYSSEIIRIWACRVSEYCDMDLDEDEFLNIEKIKFSEAVNMVMENKIPDGKTQMAILKTALLLEKNLI